MNDTMRATVPTFDGQVWLPGDADLTSGHHDANPGRCASSKAVHSARTLGEGSPLLDLRLQLLRRPAAVAEDEPRAEMIRPVRPAAHQGVALAVRHAVRALLQRHQFVPADGRALLHLGG